MEIAKTIKLFIGGDFPRTESGRSYQVCYNKSDKIYAELCRASRKDFRNAVSAGLKAGNTWARKTAYNRSQILYRMAEMMEAKKQEFQNILIQVMGLSEDEAQNQTQKSIDSLVYYSGFADKYQQVMGAVNPVAGPHHNFTTAEPVGLVTLVLDEKAKLFKITSDIAAILAGGNTIIALLPGNSGVLLAALAEVFATSDLPKGAVNLLSGATEELKDHIGGHMEVDAVSYQGTSKENLAGFKSLGIENMKRITGPHVQQECLDNIINYVEYKTVWHPIGQ